jgi:CubicO group peptidase (beta-lactamase class C family)
MKVLKCIAQSATTYTLLAASQTLGHAAESQSDSVLQAQLEARYQGDLRGACVMVAVIDKAEVRRARICAQQEKTRLPDWNSAFEIGSITKTMTAFLVSDLIDKGKWSLEDPIAQHLPSGTYVPRQGNRQILVRDLLTHSSGLPSTPSRMRVINPQDPWADLTVQELLDSLIDVNLSDPIGSKTAYSNFGMALVSLAVSRAYGTDYETAIRSALFEPLGMWGAYIHVAPPGVTPAQGHSRPGVPIPAWTLNTNLSGIGMVRATLDDMVRYTQAQLGLLKTPLYGRLKATHAPLVRDFGMGWGRAVIRGNTYISHSGGTGGFASVLHMDPEKQRAVVLLSDTSNGGGEAEETALALLDPNSPMPKARIAVTTSKDALQHMPGDYTVEGVNYKVWAQDQELWVSVPGQASELMFMDSSGTFHSFGALINVGDLSAPVQRISVLADGEQVEGLRVGYKPQYQARNPLWVDWAGEYQLLPGFNLKVFEENARLYAQASGQLPIEVEVAGNDRIQAPSYDVVIEFLRNAQGRVTSLTLKQDGNRMNAPKTP